MCSTSRRQTRFLSVSRGLGVVYKRQALSMID
jgi:hypothetical protein